MKGLARAIVAILALLASSSAWAESQFKLLVLAIPNKYHYEYIPVARESRGRSAR